jgi:hypothetical protein
MPCSPSRFHTPFRVVDVIRIQIIHGFSCQLFFVHLFELMVLFALLLTAGIAMIAILASYIVHLETTSAMILMSS